MLPMISRPGSDDLKPLHVQAPPGTAYRDKGMMKKFARAADHAGW